VRERARPPLVDEKWVGRLLTTQESVTQCKEIVCMFFRSWRIKAAECRVQNRNPPWISSWIFVGFLLSSPPYAQSFLRKPSFLVLADFFPWFFKSKQLLGFLGVVFMLKQGPNRNIIFYL
jgi:hypothetical protein